MIIDFLNLSFYVKPGFTDMRKAINGLAVMAETEMNLDPFSESIFLFCGKNKKLLKALYWDRNGFCLWQKRLEKEKFPWPENSSEAEVISFEKLKMLLEGIDFWKAHKKILYKSVV
jgi:transposase